MHFLARDRVMLASFSPASPPSPALPRKRPVDVKQKICEISTCETSPSALVRKKMSVKLSVETKCVRERVCEQRHERRREEKKN